MTTAWISVALIAGSLSAISWRTYRWWLDRRANRAHVRALVALELRKAALEGEAVAELDRHFELARHITDPNHPHHQPGGCIACEATQNLHPDWTWADADQAARNLGEVAESPERVVTAVELEWLERAYSLPAYEPERRA